MLRKPKIRTLILIICTIIISSYLLISTTIGTDRFKNLKSLINDEQRQLIKKYIFPYKLIFQQQQTLSEQKQSLSEQQQTLSEQKQSLSEQQQIISQQKQTISQQKQTISQKQQTISQHSLELELIKKQEGSEIILKKSTLKLSNNKTLKKYNLTSGFYAGMMLTYPGSGYIDFYENNIIVLSARGILVYKKNIEDVEESFKQIKNNINEFISIKEFKKAKKFNWFSLKDIFIINNKIYISYTEEIKKDCWSTSIIYGDMNYKNINFERLFSSKECIHSKKNIDNEFNALQAGGKIISFDDNHILLSIGDYKERYLAQDTKSVFGKIIKVNTNNGNYEIISIGHRNPQGLYFDKENNFILETEHGPQGGDEVNLIGVNEINKGKIQNYGWPISSAGEHYGGKIEKNKIKYTKYPLYKSHSEHGFIEPLKSFTPSIGITEIVKIGPNRYALSSLRTGALYFFELNKEREIIDLETVEVFERVRDLRFSNNQLYLFMESTASIGVINLN